MAGGAPSGSMPVPYQDFHGGLNTLDNPFLLTENEARDLQNVQGTTAGAIVKRTGLVTFASPANVFNSLYALESISPTVLIGADSGAIYSVSTGGAVTSLGSGFSNNRWSFISAPVVSGRGPLYAMNGVDTPQYWSGTGAAASWTAVHGTVPNGKYMIYNQNQVFVSGVSTNPSRLYWSGIADPTDWDPANLNGAGFEDFDPNDGEAITGIGVVGPYVFVAKARKCWVLVSTATAQSRKISDNIGCVAHRSIASGPEGTYFLAEDRGVYVTNGTKLTPISDKIQPTLDGLSGLRSQASGVYFNAHYYLSVPSQSATNDTTLDYDAKLGSWWKHTFGSNQFAVWHPTGTAQLYSAKSVGSVTIDQCFVPGVYTDNGQPFTWIYRHAWQSPIFFRHKIYNVPWFRKNLRQMRIQGTGTVDVSLAKDFAGLETLKQANVFGSQQGGIFGASDGSIFGGNDGSMFGAPSILGARLFSFGVANSFSVVLSATSTTQDEVVLFVLLLTDRKDLVVAW